MTSQREPLRLDYTGKFAVVNLQNGTYKFRLWGAQGGCHDSGGGRGAYSEGIYKASKNEQIIVYVGKQGTCSDSNLQKTDFGGGGTAVGITKYESCTGGEATFININTNEVLIVAGAGGGSGYMSNNEYFGGYGGPTAGDGQGNEYATQNRDKVNFTGKGATASYPGKGGQYYEWKSSDSKILCTAEDGSKFSGGSACAVAYGSAGGGGSGYYGGGGGADVAGGGGGSSYASQKIGSVFLLNGNMYFTDQNGQPEIGHGGNGFVIIEESYEEYIYHPCPVIVCSEYEKIFLNLNTAVMLAAIYS